MIRSQLVTTLENALIIHAILASIVFTLVSFIYFKKLNYIPMPITAIRSVAVVVLMCFFIVSLFINQIFDILSPTRTWDSLYLGLYSNRSNRFIN